MGLPVLNPFDAMTGVSFNLITGLASTTPLVESGAGAVGTATDVARADHVHPAAAGSGSSQALNLFSANLVVPSSYSQYFVGAVQTNGYILDIEGGLVGVI
jgi:hypothetical protein